MDRLRILDTRNQIRTDKNPSRPDQIRIRSENIRTIYIPIFITLCSQLLMSSYSILCCAELYLCFVICGLTYFITISLGQHLGHRSSRQKKLGCSRHVTMCLLASLLSNILSFVGQRGVGRERDWEMMHTDGHNMNDMAKTW